MVKEHIKPGKFINPGNPFEHQDDPETELAFAIQNASPGDPQLLEILVESYSGEVFRLVSALVAARGDEDQLSRKICTIVEDAFAEAYRNPDRFRGENGVRTWLFKLAINRIRQDRLLGHLEWLWHKQPSEKSWAKVVKTQPRGEQNALIWHSAENLPFRARLIVVLRYVYGMDLAEITDLLGISPARLTKQLTRFRRSCQLLEQDGKGSIPHPHYRKMIDQSVDGVLNEDPYRREQIEGHLIGCQNCQSYAEELQAIEKTLNQSLRARWPMPSLEGSQLEDLREAAQGERFDHPQRNRSILKPVFRGSWIAAGMLAAASLIWGLTQLSDIQYEKVFPPTKTPTQLPPRSPIISPTIFSASGMESPPESELTAHLMPSLSSDGDWVTFTSLQSTPKVYIYDRASGSLETLPLPTLSNSPVGIMLQTLISGDGRYVAYNTPTGNYLGINIYDREEDSIHTISAPPGNTSGFSFSFLAGISKDGRWILYWSTDKGQDTGKRDGCLSEGENDGCMEFFLYDQETGNSTRIPIGRQNYDNFMGFKSDISADGRWISLTVFETDFIADQLNLQHQTEAFLFDRERGEFQPLNVNDLGDPGNGDSYRAIITSDGHFAAFASTSTNLVPDDTNGFADVFVRDLDSGVLQRVSLSSNGEQGNGGSGSVQSFFGSWGENIGISGDGRYVSFLSEAENLAPVPAGGCTSVSYQRHCESLYLHDRQTGETKRVTPLVNSEEKIYIFPDLSSDGRWLAYTEFNPNCDQNSIRRVCAEVWLYDQQNDWTSPLSKGVLPEPLSSWRSEDRLRSFGSGISSLALSPDRNLVAIGYYDGSIRLFKKDDGSTQILQSLRPTTSISSLNFFPDGKFLAAGRTNGTLEIWRLSDAVDLYTIENNSGGVIDAEFSPQSNILSISTRQTISFWQLQGKFFVNLNGLHYPAGFLKDLALSPSGNWLAAATEENTVWLVEVPTGRVILRLDNLDKGVSSVAFSTDESLLAVGSSDGSVNLWTVKPGDPGELEANYLQTFKTRRQIAEIAFSKDSKILAALTYGEQLYFWNLPDGSPAANPLWNQNNLNPNGLMVFDGESFAISTSAGDLRIFQKDEITNEPRFFKPSFDDHLLVGSVSRINLGIDAFDSFPLDLYQADMLSDFDLRVPTYMPPGVTFSGAYLSENGFSAVIHYQVRKEKDSQPSADIYLFQHEPTGSSPEFIIGRNATIKRVQIANRNAEFVQGGWVAPQTDISSPRGMSSISSLTWDSQAPYQWLRWQDTNALFTILVRGLEVETPGISYFNEADLVEIAGKVMKLSQVAFQEPLHFTYTVQAGDTCSDIATRFGSTVGEIMRLNKLTNNCNYIFAGETLTVPLSKQRVTLDETDLNCDGQSERIRLIPIPDENKSLQPTSISSLERISFNKGSSPLIQAPFRLEGPQGTGSVFGVIVENLSPLRFYQEVWHYTIADTGGKPFYVPQLSNREGCEVYLSLDLPEGENTFRQQVFRWNGFRIDQIQATSP